MPPYELGHKARHGAGLAHSEDLGVYVPRHGIDYDLIERIEDATGLNGETFIETLRREGLSIVRTVAA